MGGMGHSIRKPVTVKKEDEPGVEGVFVNSLLLVIFIIFIEQKRLWLE